MKKRGLQFYKRHQDTNEKILKTPEKQIKKIWSPERNGLAAQTTPNTPYYISTSNFTPIIQSKLPPYSEYSPRVRKILSTMFKA